MMYLLQQDARHKHGGMAKERKFQLSMYRIAISGIKIPLLTISFFREDK